MLSGIKSEKSGRGLLEGTVWAYTKKYLQKNKSLS
jgi:hypothetical protein